MRAASTLALTIFLGLGALSAGARDLTGEFAVSSSETGGGYCPAAAMDVRGEVLVVWAQEDGVFGRRFDRNGDPRGDDFQVGTRSRNYLGPVDASLDARGFTVVWGESSTHSGSIAILRRFDGAGQPLSGAVDLGAGFSAGAPSVGTDGRGNSVAVLWDQGKVAGSRFDALGRRIGPRFEVAQGAAGGPKVAVAGDGSFVVAWASTRGAFGRRYDAAANPLGPAFVVAASASEIALAGNARGRFAVAWSSSLGIQARTFGPAGARKAVLVTSERQTFGLSMAMDAADRFLVTWACCAGLQRPGTIFGRFFEASGAPLDGVFPVSLRTPGSDANPDAAAGPAGDFLVVWQRTFEDQPNEIVGRFLNWSPRGADPCLAGVSTFACDVSRDGGAPEITTPLARLPGDVPLLGDLDDDRRDDSCLFRNGRFFLCDTAHDGSPDVQIAFGQPGDAPLLGDLDGEGRADPCVRRGGQILCDTAHDGGTAEVVVTFGPPGGRILLGDVDGDGDDDPCLVSGGRLSCDTEHDGAAAEVQIPFALQAGDVPLLGDADGDGRADPCVFRGGRFLCDTRRSGSLAPFGQPFTAEPGSVPLLGNVNGI